MTTTTATGGDRCGVVGVGRRGRPLKLPPPQVRYARCLLLVSCEKGMEGGGRGRGRGSTAADPPEGPQQNLRFTLMNSILYGLLRVFRLFAL